MKKLTLAIALFLLSLPVMAQSVESDSSVVATTAVQTKQKKSTPQKNDSFFKVSNITYGGGVGFNLTKDYANVLVAPEIGYRLFKPWVINLMLKYQYTHYSDNANVNLWGIGVSTKVDLFSFSKKSATPTRLFLYGGYNFDYYVSSDVRYDKMSRNTAGAGLGLRQYFGSRGSNAYVLVSWILWDDTVPEWGWDKIEWSPNVAIGVEF